MVLIHPGRLEAVFSFIYDVIKIVFLLCVLIFVISYIQSFFPPERTKRILGTFHGIGANVLAALLGTVIEKLHLENQVEEFIRNAKQIDILQEELTVKDRIKYAWEQVVETLKKVFPYNSCWCWNRSLYS